MHPITKLQLGNTDSLIINTRSNRQLVESQFNAVYLSEKELAIGAWLSETSLG